jgi:hypothetical protein
MCAAASNLGGGHHHFAPPTSYGAYQGEITHADGSGLACSDSERNLIDHHLFVCMLVEGCPPRRVSDGTAGGAHVWQGRCFFFAAAGLAISPASMTLHRRYTPHAQPGNRDAPSDSDDMLEAQSHDKLKPEKQAGPRTLEEFMDAHPRAVAFIKLVVIALCTFVCYLSSKGDPRVKLLVESAKDAAEVYAFLATVLILLKKFLFPGSGKKR